jgi:hypothetical protein
MIEYLGNFLLALPAFTTFFWFLSNVYLKRSLSISSLFICLMVSVAVSILYLPSWRPQSKKEKFTFFAGLLLSLILGLYVLNIILNLYYPPYLYDAVTNFDYKGRVFFYEHNIQGIEDVFHASYPFFTSLGHTALYMLRLSNPSPYYSFVIGAYLLALFSWSRKHMSLVLSLANTLLVFSTPIIFFHSHIGYSNMPYMAYLSLAILYLSDYINVPSLDNLKLVSLFLAIPVWIRPAHHPFFLFGFFIVIVRSWNTKKWHPLYPLLTYIFFALPWIYFQQRILNLPSYESSNLPKILPQLIPIFHNAPDVFTLLINCVTSPTFVGTLPALLFTILPLQFITDRRKMITTLFWVTLGVLITWFLLSIVFRVEFDSYHDWLIIINDSMRRLFIAFIPLLYSYLLSLPVVKELFD